MANQQERVANVRCCACERKCGTGEVCDSTCATFGAACGIRGLQALGSSGERTPPDVNHPVFATARNLALRFRDGGGVVATWVIREVCEAITAFDAGRSPPAPARPATATDECAACGVEECRSGRDGFKPVCASCITKARLSASREGTTNG